MVYVIATLLSILLACMAVNIQKGSLKTGNKKNAFRLCAFFSFFPLAIVSAVRFGVGTDFYIYYYGYKHVISWDEFEIAFRYLLTFLNIITSEPQLFFVVSSFFICGSYFYAIYKESVNPVYSILLFVLTRDYFRSMNGVRQYIALAIGIFALPYIKKKEWKKVIPIILVACAFHTSAIIYFVLLFFYVVNIKPYKVLIAVGCMFFFGNAFKDMLFPILKKYTHYAKFYSHYMYAESGFEFTTFLIYLAFLILLTYEYNKVRKKESLKLLYTAVLIGAIVVISGAVMPKNVARFAWYMNSIIAIYVPEATQSLTDKRIAFIVNIAIIVFYFLITTTGTLEGSNDVLPYRAYWEQS